MKRFYAVILICSVMCFSSSAGISVSNFPYNKLQNSGIFNNGKGVLPSAVQLISNVNFINQMNKSSYSALARRSASNEKLDSIVSTVKKSIYTYNTHGHLLTEENVTPDSLYKTDFDNDDLGNVTKMTSSIKNDTSNAWENTEKIEITYNTHGKMDVCLTSRWENSIWIPVFKIEYAYDLQNLVRSITWSVWKNESFEEATRYNEYTYDSNGRVLSFEASSIDEETLNYEKISKIVYSYSSGGVIASFHQFLFNSTNSTWTENSKSESEFDSDGNLISVTEYLTLVLTSTLKEISRTEYFLENVPVQNLILPPGFSSVNQQINKKILKTISYNIDNANNWVAVDTAIYYYSVFNTAVLPPNNKLVSGKSGLTMVKSGNKIMLVNNSKSPLQAHFYSLQGHLIKSFTIAKALNIDLSNFPGGHYVVQYRSNGHQNTLKLIKE